MMGKTTFSYFGIFYIILGNPSASVRRSRNATEFTIDLPGILNSTLAFPKLSATNDSARKRSKINYNENLNENKVLLDDYPPAWELGKLSQKLTDKFTARNIWPRWKKNRKRPGKLLPSDAAEAPTVQDEKTQQCSEGTHLQNQSYTRSFPAIDASSMDLAGIFRVAGEPDAKRTGSVHTDEDITLCWIETTTIKEDRTFDPPKRLVSREYTISFENFVTIPEKYLECAKLDGEIATGDVKSVCDSSLQEVIDRDTKRSRVVNFTSANQVDSIFVHHQKTVRCAIGGVVYKDVYEWPDGSTNPRKRVEIKVGPAIGKLGQGTQKNRCSKSKDVDDENSTERFGKVCPTGGNCTRIASMDEKVDDEPVADDNDDKNHKMMKKYQLKNDTGCDTSSGECLGRMGNLPSNDNAKNNNVNNNDNSLNGETRKKYGTENFGERGSFRKGQEEASRRSTVGSPIDKTTIPDETLMETSAIPESSSSGLGNIPEDAVTSAGTEMPEENLTKKETDFENDPESAASSSTELRSDQENSTNSGIIDSESIVTELPTIEELENVSKTVESVVTPQPSDDSEIGDSTVESPTESESEAIPTETPNGTLLTEEELERKPTTSESSSIVQTAVVLEPCNNSTAENCTPSETTTEKIEVTEDTVDENIMKNCTEGDESCGISTEPSNEGIATTTPKEFETFSTVADNESSGTTTGSRRSTAFIQPNLTSTATGDRHRNLTLRIKVLLEHINENEEKEKLVQVEKHLLLNEQPDEDGYHNLVWRVKSLNNSMNIDTLKAICNFTELTNFTEIFSNITEFKRDYDTNNSTNRRSLRIAESVTDEDSALEDMSSAGSSYESSSIENSNESSNQSRRKRATSGSEDHQSESNSTGLTTEAAIIRESLPKVNEDLEKGLDHVLARISEELNKPENPETVTKFEESTSLPTTSTVTSANADPLDQNPLIQRRKRSSSNLGDAGTGKEPGVMSIKELEKPVNGEEIDRWSSERFVSTADGGRVRSLLEFKIIRGPDEDSRRIPSAS